MSNLDRAFANWYAFPNSSAGDVADECWFGDRSLIVSDDSVDMEVWAATHTIDTPDHDGLWGNVNHGPVANGPVANA